MKKIFILILLLFSTSVHSSEVEMNFSKDNFFKAKESGKTIVVNSWNKWCGTCIKQEKVFKQARKDFKDVLFLTFKQSNKDIAKLLNIDYRSTIVIFKNNEEIVRAIGITKKEEIYSLIKSGT
tara:strand:- start:95 stop:463 length:369 start_codon:yes stop_codon:yes gene_type:complete